MAWRGAGKKARSGLICLLAVWLAGCASFRATKHTYAAGDGGASLNGARLRMQVLPQGDSGGVMVSAMVVAAGSTTLDGPFRWRIEAQGQQGHQQELVLHRLHTRTTATKRSEWYPPQHLGRRALFHPLKDEPGRVVARYEIPGLLEVKPRIDGELTITADVSVKADGRWRRGMVKFRLRPDCRKQSEVIFLPAEVVKGLSTAPGDWDDPLWD